MTPDRSAAGSNFQRGGGGGGSGGGSGGGAGGLVGSKKYLWSIGYYQQFFDVDTNEVIKRCWAAIFPRSNFLDVLDGNPDLYGPLLAAPSPSC